MAKIEKELERITITVPRRMAEEIALRVDYGTFASVSEWIRHAMREQLARDGERLDELIRRKPEIEESLNDALAGRVTRLRRKKSE
jgi:Arc/MetJ-type ribon-helix-helix transcriptional regulator